MSPEATAAFEALHLLAKWLPAEIGPLASMALQLAKNIAEREDDPLVYMRNLLEADARRQAALKFG